jgi:hypothetical protein
LSETAALVDFVRVLSVLPLVECERLFGAPAGAMRRLRQRGQSAPLRSAACRASLRGIIAVVDRFFPGGGNCYRRAMLETCLDAGAAREQLMLGLRSSGGPRSGHAWLASSPDTGNVASYDAIVEM